MASAEAAALAQVRFGFGEDGLVDSVAPLPARGRLELGDFGSALAGEQVGGAGFQSGGAGIAPAPAGLRFEVGDFGGGLAGQQDLQGGVVDDTRVAAGVVAIGAVHGHAQIRFHGLVSFSFV